MAKRTASNSLTKAPPTKSAPAAAPVAAKAPVATKITTPASACGCTSATAAMGKGNGGDCKPRITNEAIAKRAYEIWKSGKGGTELENWIRAERELKAAATAVAR